MFNTFFHGTIDEMLNHVGTAPTAEIDRVDDPDKKLYGEELIQTVMDISKIPRDEAEKLVGEIQMEELNRICNDLLEKGLIELVGYDDDGLPKYLPIK